MPPKPGYPPVPLYQFLHRDPVAGTDLHHVKTVSQSRYIQLLIAGHALNQFAIYREYGNALNYFFGINRNHSTRGIGK